MDCCSSPQSWRLAAVSQVTGSLDAEHPCYTQKQLKRLAPFHSLYHWAFQKQFRTWQTKGSLCPFSITERKWWIYKPDEWEEEPE